MMLKLLPDFLVGLLSTLVGGFALLKEKADGFWADSCKLTKAKVDGYVDLSFRLHTIPYRIRFKRLLGPSSYTRIENERGDDVTRDVSQFAGPCRNFYGIPTTPQILGFGLLKVFYRKGGVKTFGGTELIIWEK